MSDFLILVVLIAVALPFALFSVISFLPLDDKNGLQIHDRD